MARRLTRDQIAKIVNNDPEAIRAIEDLFRTATSEQPAEIVALRDDVDGILSEPEQVYGLESLAWLQRIEDRLNRAARGRFIKTANQVAGAINTAEAITFTTASLTRGTSLGSPASRIVIERSGIYQFDFAAQILSNTAVQKTMWLWFAIDGTAVANSAIVETEAANGGSAVVQRSEMFQIAAGSYVECYFAVDNVDLILSANAATGFSPAAPACLLNVTQVTP